MIRPPPLQLKHDNFKLTIRSPVPPPRPKRQDSFYAKLYQANWRNAVIAIAGLNALRFFLSASNAFRDVYVDKSQHAPNLVKISTALGAMYLTTSVIEIFGIISAASRRLLLVRIYTHLAFIAAILVTVAGIMAAFAYFKFADDLVHECISLAMNGNVVTKSIFRGRPWPRISVPLSQTDAQHQCINAWTSESPSQILSVLLFSLLPSAAYFFLAYNYYRQTTDPQHAGSLCSNRPSVRSAVRMEAYPGAAYAPLRNVSDNADEGSNTLASGRAGPSRLNPRSARRAAQVHARTDPKPKAQRKDTVAPPPQPSKLQVQPRPSQPQLQSQSQPRKSTLPNLPKPLSIMKSSSPLGYMLTPGPPSFNAYAPYEGASLAVYSLGSDGDSAR